MGQWNVSDQGPEETEKGSGPRARWEGPLPAPPEVERAHGSVSYLKSVVLPFHAHHTGHFVCMNEMPGSVHKRRPCAEVQACPRHSGVLGQRARSDRLASPSPRDTSLGACGREGAAGYAEPHRTVLGRAAVREQSAMG